jgi:MFS family permease/transposase
VDVEKRVWGDHPLRVIRRIVNETLTAMSAEFDALYPPTGRESIPPERWLRALLLQAFYTIRSERQLVERIEFDQLFRWFVGLGMDDPVWNATTFTKNRDRLLAGEIAAKFLAGVLTQPQVKALLSTEHFSVDGTLLEAWASTKSFRPKDASGPPSDPGRNGEQDFRGQKRSNDTHASTTDPEERLFRKGPGKEAKLCCTGHALMENRNGLIVGAVATLASGHAERWCPRTIRANRVRTRKVFFRSDVKTRSRRALGRRVSGRGFSIPNFRFDSPSHSVLISSWVWSSVRKRVWYRQGSLRGLEAYPRRRPVPVRGEEETPMDVVVPNRQRVDPLERETIRRVIWRLLPVLMLGYFCNFLDRVNVGMAATTMNQQLGFSSAVFGFGAGLFFVGYVAAEIPSNLILNMVGARRWIARILISWGIVSGLTAFVWNDWSFYGIRCLLGLAEAGYFPGVILYLTWWFPSFYAARMIGVFYAAAVASMFIGPPISGLLLMLDGALGMHGWQWLFIVEAMPPVIMCFVTWWFLTDRPTEATWLRPDQKAWLVERLASERAQREAIQKFSLGDMFGDPNIWLLALAYFCYDCAFYGLTFFLPLVVKGLGVSTGFMIGLVSAVPSVFALVAMLCWGWHSDRSGERIWHVGGAWLLFSAGMAACAVIGVGHPVVTMVALIFGTMGMWACLPSFWSIPSALLTGVAAAGGIAMINSVGQVGGWLGPWVFGLVRDASGSDNIALLSLSLAPIMSVILLLVASRGRGLGRKTQAAVGS